jgi:hypothetical protein
VGPRAGLDAVEETEFLTLPGLELRLAVQSVASRYISPTVLILVRRYCICLFPRENQPYGVMETISVCACFL